MMLPVRLTPDNQNTIANASSPASLPGLGTLTGGWRAYGVIMKIRIDKDLQDQLPALATEEYQALREKIMHEGVRPGAIVVADIRGDHVLCDGHNTTKVAKELGIPVPEPVVLTFQSREEVVEWINENQFGRRNAAEVWKQQQRERRVHRVANARANGQSLRTIAKAENVSESTVRTDLEKAGAQGVRTTPEGGKVTGSDGVK